MLQLRNIMIPLAVTLSSLAACSAQAQGLQRTPDAVDVAVEPRSRAMICMATLEVTEEGAHLREGQVLAMIGPIFDGSYLVIPIHPGAVGVESLKWESKPLVATDAGVGEGIYMLDGVRVTEPDGEHLTPETHPMVLQVTEMEDGCPTEIDIHGFRHTGTMGLHGGRAHASGT